MLRLLRSTRGATSHNVVSKVRMLATPLIQKAHVTTDKKNIIKSILPDVEMPTVSLPEFILKVSQGPKHEYGDQIAFKMRGKELSYNDLKRQAMSLGTAIYNDLGMKKGSVMAILSPNCLEYVPVLYGIMMVGVTATTLNPGYTPGEIAYQLNDSKADSIVIHAALLDNLKKAEPELIKPLKHVVVIGDKPENSEHLWYDDLAAGDGESLPKVDIDVKRDIALLPYSSGTTGRPKGVALSNFNLAVNVTQTQDGGLMPIEHGVKQLALLPLFHMYGLLMCGNIGVRSGWTMSILPAFDPVEFLETIQNDKIELMHIVPPLVVFLAKHPLVDNYDLTSIKSIFSAAAPLGRDTAELLAKRLPWVDTIRQGYGMTEMSPVSHLDSDQPTMGSVGVLVSNTEAKFLDPESHEEIEVTPGQVGELCIRGPQVMLGYLNRPEETDATMTSDGFLRTGDVGHMDEKNHLFIHDRLKELIKVKGLQVAPTELEDHLISHPSVSDAAVIARYDEFAGELPKAYVVKTAGASETEENIREWLNGLHAKHKHLCEVEFIDAIPKNPSGKILRRLLRDKEKASQAEKAASL